MSIQAKSHNNGNKAAWKKPSVALAGTAGDVRGGAVLRMTETVFYSPS